MKKLFWIIVVVVIAVVAIKAFSPKTATTDEKAATNETGPLTIGYVGPLTGDAASYGEVSKNGVVVAAEQINAAGGINGRQVNVVYEDGKCNGADAAGAAQKLINVDKVSFIITGECSGGALAIAPIIDQAKIFTLANIATSPKVSGVSKYLIRNAPNDAARGVLLADYAKKSGYKKVAVIAEQTDYSQALKETFLAQAEKDGLQVVSKEDFVTDTQDFKSILAKVKSANPDVVFFDTQTDAGFVRVATQARQVGIKSAFIGSEFNGPVILAAGSVVEGTVIAVAPGLAKDGSGNAYREAYKKKFGQEPSYPYYSGAAYDDLMILKKAIEAVGTDSTKVRDYVRNLPSYTGTIGTYSFDEKGDVKGINFVFQKVSGGKFVDMQ